MNRRLASRRLSALSERPGRLLGRLFGLSDDPDQPHFSGLGSLLMLGAICAALLVAMSILLKSDIQAELAGGARQRIDDLDRVLTIAGQELDALAPNLPTRCDEQARELLTRASLNSRKLNQVHRVPVSGKGTCSPLNSIHDPVAAPLQRARERQNGSTIGRYLIAPANTGESLLIARRYGPDAYLVGEIYADRLADYLYAGRGIGSSLQLQGEDGAILFHTGNVDRGAGRAGSDGLRPLLPDGWAAWIEAEATSDQHPVTLRIQSDVAAVAARAVRYVIAAMTLGILLTLGLVACINLALAERGSVERRLRNALRKRQFEPVIQPIVDARSGRCIGGEILMRWRHPARGLLPPVDFLAVAEQTGLIDQMTLLIMNKARHRLSGVIKRHPSLYFTFNVGAAQLRDPAFPDTLDGIFNTGGLPPDNVAIELIEREALDGPSRGALALIRARGYRIAIDDFGTGQSSLSLLASIGFDILKIDREFVASADTDPVKQPVLAAIIKLAQEMGARTVAEGVETAGEYEYLVQQGADAIQGYLVCRPIPLNEFERWLADAGAAAHYPRTAHSSRPASRGQPTVPASLSGPAARPITSE